MPLYVNSNLASLNARRQVNRATNGLDTAFERLSSGQRINSAKDDAAGLQISNRLSTQIDGLSMGNRNAQDCISYAQTAEGALDEITNMLQRIRTLSLQAANGTYSPTDRAALQQEVDHLNKEIVRVAKNTSFAGQDLLNGKAGVLPFQVGPNPSSIIKIDLTCGFDTDQLTDLTVELSGDEFTIPASESWAGGTFKYKDVFKYDPQGGGINISTPEEAQKVLGGIDGLINAIDTKRAELGAIQNRVEATIRNQANVSENVHAARAQIRDTDWAEETANLTAMQILQQSSTSVLTQANTRPQIALSLLQK